MTRRQRTVYDTPAWRTVRQHVLTRDNHTCQIRGPRCLTTANSVDHIIPWEDGGSLYDPANLRAACTPCNSARASRHKADHGWRRATTRITLVTGPPAAGKTTWVNQHRQPGDLVIDFDAIAEAIGSPDTHNHNPATTTAANTARNAIIQRLRRGELDAPHVWLISAHPNAEHHYPHHDVHRVDPGPDVAHQQARQAGRPDQWHQLIDAWYTNLPHSRTW